MRILVLVDLQNDFFPKGALGAPLADRVIAPVNELIERGGYDMIVATQDWHPDNHGSFAVNNPGAEAFSMGTLDGIPQRFWPKHCVAGTPGAELHPAIRRDLIDVFVHKGTLANIDSYSGFFDNQGRNETPLRSILLRRIGGPENISQTQVDIAGLVTEICAGDTALDSCRLGFKTRFVRDASCPLNPENEIAMFERLKAAGAEIVTTRDIILEAGFREQGTEIKRRGMQLSA